MREQHKKYSNISWALFEVFNDNKTEAFEAMCLDLFSNEYLKGTRNPHADHNNPGVEVVPIQEPERIDGQSRRYISFQAKYFENSISDSQIIHSLEVAVRHYAGKLDVIYLFCNKVISQNSKRYRKYEEVLAPANIKLELVTDKDIFALLRKHSKVADYFFQDRKRATVGANPLMDAITFPASVSDVEPPSTSERSSEIWQELVDEKIQKCRCAVKDLKFGELKSELDKLVKIDEMLTDERIILYRIIYAIHNKEDITELINLLPEEQREEAYWIKSFSKNPHNISIDELTALTSELQIVVLDILFASQCWNCIQELHKDRDKITSDVLKAFDFHYGLSLFNLGDFEQSHIILEAVGEILHSEFVDELAAERSNLLYYALEKYGAYLR